MAITKAAVARRVAALAQRMGCCARHGVKLHCLCTSVWTGTKAEVAEIVALLEKFLPYLHPLIYTDEVCPCCHTARWCASCNVHQDTRVIPPDVTTEAEMARYRELCALVRERRPDDGPEMHLTWNEPEPTRAPEPVESAMRQPRRTPEPAPVPEPEPVIVVDEEAALDGEIQEILAQLQARTTDDQTGIADRLKSLLDQCD
jgi:hypothetical protein